MKKINYNKHVFEGWTVRDFIEYLEEDVERFISNSEEFHTNITKDELKKFCMDNQPYYKKYIPEVVKYFAAKYKIK